MNAFRFNLLTTAAIGLGCAVLGTMSGAGTQHLICLILIWGIFAIGFDLVFGVAGILSFGHAAFFGAGAYAYAVLTLDHDVGGVPALIAAGLLGAALAAAVAAITLRLAGIYLALVTLAAAQLINVLAEIKLKTLTGGTDGRAGVPRPEFFGFSFDADGAYLGFIVVLFCVLMATSALLRASPFGQVLRAIRQNELRTLQLGFDTRLYKLGAFAISGAYAGLAGALLGGLMTFVGPDNTRWTTSGDVLIMTVLGGRGTFAGPVVGVALFETLKEGVSAYTEHWYGVVGLVFIAVTLLMPGGVVGLLISLWNRRTGAAK